MGSVEMCSNSPALPPPPKSVDLWFGPCCLTSYFGGWASGSQGFNRKEVAAGSGAGDVRRAQGGCGSRRGDFGSPAATTNKTSQNIQKPIQK